MLITLKVPAVSRRLAEAAIGVVILTLFLIVAPPLVPCSDESQAPHGPCEALLPWAIGIAAAMMLNRVVFRYNDLIDRSAEGSRALRAQALLGTVIIGSVSALACEWFQCLLAAEVIMVACELILILTLMRLAKPGKRLNRGLLHEILTLVVLAWIGYVALCPAWRESPWSIAPMIVGSIVPAHLVYVAETVVHCRSKWEEGGWMRPMDGRPRLTPRAPFRPGSRSDSRRKANSSPSGGPEGQTPMSGCTRAAVRRCRNRP